MRKKLDINTIKPGQMLYITYVRSWRPYDTIHSITSFISSPKEVGSFTIDGYYMFGHEYNMDKQMMTCGSFGLSSEDTIVEVETITKKEFNAWKKEYEAFHISIIEEKGIDYCEEDIKKLFI